MKIATFNINNVRRLVAPAISSAATWLMLPRPDDA
jgi:hypothetical protein